jgi:hypothetical protein
MYVKETKTEHITFCNNIMLLLQPLKTQDSSKINIKKYVYDTRNENNKYLKYIESKKISNLKQLFFKNKYLNYKKKYLKLKTTYLI